MNYYNENDPKAAAWLRELIKSGYIPSGDVDERSIVDVKHHELDNYTQCHFFAGIGGWNLALQLAGWPNDRPIWTGSCPCQPFSVASDGGAKGQSDERHLWPTWLSLIRERKPATIIGEQVAQSVNWGWWDFVALDLEELSYACAAAVLRADAIGASHERRRLYWVAHACGTRWERHQPVECVPIPANAAQSLDGNPLVRARKALDGDFDGLLHCDGVSVVMERSAIKGYGNSIVPQVAAEFIQAFLESQLE